jgi:ribosomal protein S27AE
VTAEGELLLRSPGGHSVRISPLDVCDIIKGKQIKVMAMPLSTWIARSRLPLKDKQQQRPGPNCYAPASVLHAHKDRWGRCSYYVRFDSPELNAPSDGTTRHAPLCDDDHRELPRRTRRTAMPVTSWPSGAAWSADHGVTHASANVQRDARAFFKAALQGQAAEASALACRDAIEMRQRIRKTSRTQPGSMT